MKERKTGQKMQDHTSEVENAGTEHAGPENGGPISE